MTKISDLQTDQNNANLGTQRGLKLLDQSLRELGAGRSILVDREGRVIAGNKTLEAAADIGIEDVILVPSDGTKLVAVQRTDLDLRDDERARRLAYYDNRVAELDLDWNIEQLLADANKLPEELWLDWELEALISAGANPDELWRGMPEYEQEEILDKALTCIVRFRTEEDRDAFEKLVGAKLQHKGKTYSTWFPPQDFDQLGRDLKFTDES